VQAKVRIIVAMAASKKTVATKVATPKGDTKKTAAKGPAKKAIAKKTARGVPKTSPLRGTSVDDYVAKLGKEQGAIVDALRRLVREHAPKASEAIKWAQPVFEENGPFAYVRASKSHVTFGFWRGVELSAPEGLLEGDGDRMKHVKIVGVKEIRAEVLGDLVRQAVLLNRQKGSPATRG
jgi:hypothetical protein